MLTHFLFTLKIGFHLKIVKESILHIGIVLDKNHGHRHFQKWTSQQLLNNSCFLFLSFQAMVDRSMEPGKPFTLPFTVMTDATGGSYKISARNDRDFKMNIPGR